MKSEWEIGYIESSYSGRLRTFPPATVERPRQTLEMFDFRFTFLRRKRTLFMHVLKKAFIPHSTTMATFRPRKSGRKFHIFPVNLICESKLNSFFLIILFIL